MRWSEGEGLREGGSHSRVAYSEESGDIRVSKGGRSVGMWYTGGGRWRTFGKINFGMV